MVDLPRIKWYAVLAIGSVFTLGGLAMIISGAEHGWAVFLFFGLCMAVATNELWPGLWWRQRADPDALMRQFPGPVELSVDKRKFLFLLVGLAIFGGVGIWFLLHEQRGLFATIMVWLAVIGCVVAVPVMIALMLQGSSLRLDREGLRIRHAWRTTVTRWRDTSEFEVAALPMVATSSGTRMVVYDDAGRSSTLGAINSGLVGRSSALPDTYGLSHEELAALLNEWRRRALDAQPGNPPRGSFGLRTPR